MKLFLLYLLPVALCTGLYLFFEVWLKRKDPEWAPFLSSKDWILVTLMPGVNMILSLLILTGIFKTMKDRTEVTFFHTFNLLPTVSVIPDAGVLVVFPLYGSLAFEPKDEIK